MAAEAAMAAREQGKFWEYSKALFDKQDAWEKLGNPQDLFVNLAKEAGVADLEKFKNVFDVHTEINFKNRWIIFSDTNDHVLFNDVSEPDYPYSILIKSKIIADIQRMQFNNFSNFFRKT